MNKKHLIYKKKILRCYLRIPPANGGMEMHISQLTIFQREIGLDVILAFNEGNKSNENDIKIFDKIILSKLFFSPFYFGLFYLNLIIRLFLYRERYDFIHLHGDWSSFIFAPILKRITKAEKVFFSFHGSINNSFSNKVLLPLTVKIFCNKIFVTGYESYKQLENTSKAVFQPSGIKEIFLQNKVKIPNKKFRFITVTFLRPQKNVITFLNIARILSEYDFIILGDGPQMEHLTEYAQKHGISNVQFLGKKSSDEIKTLLDCSDLFIFTSLEEGTPTAIMEAMACGLPIITSNAGGAESIVKDNINGFVIKNDYTRAEKYCDFISLLLSDRHLIEKIRKKNISDAKLFSWDNVGAKISKIMDQV